MFPSKMYMTRSLNMEEKPKCLEKIEAVGQKFRK